MDERSKLIGSGYGGINVELSDEEDRVRASSSSGMFADLKQKWKELRHGRERVLPVLLCTLAATVGSCLNGFMLGYSALTQLDLENDYITPFDKFAKTSYYQFIGPAATIGALIGGPLAGLFSDKLGRKTAMMVSAFPLATGWLCIALSIEFYYYQTTPNGLYAMLLLGRFLTGFGTGWLSLVVPVYIIEISPASLKGLFGSVNQLSVTVGILLIYAFGTGLRYYEVAIVSLAFVLLYVLLLFLIPETPRWLVSNGLRLEANNTLWKLRGPKAEVMKEMDTLEKAVAVEGEISFHDKLRMLKQRAVFIPLIFSILLMFFQQFSGINVVIFYAGRVLSSAGLPQNDAAFAADFGIGGIQVIATFVGVMLVDVLGRKVLLLIGAVFMTLSTGVLGTYYIIDYLSCHGGSTNETVIDKSWCHMDHFYILSVLCLALFIVGFSISWGPIPWVMMGELAPMQVRGLLSGIATFTNWSFATIVTGAFSSYQDSVRPYGAWWSFAFCTVLSIPFVIFFLPETKGKDLQEIQEFFDNKYGRRPRQRRVTDYEKE